MNELTQNTLWKKSQKENLLDLHKARSRSVSMVWNTKFKNREAELRNFEEMEYVNAPVEHYPHIDNIEEYLSRELMELNETQEKLLEQCYQRRRVLCTLIDKIRQNKKQQMPVLQKTIQFDRGSLPKPKPCSQAFNSSQNTLIQSNVIRIFSKDRNVKDENKAPRSMHRPCSVREIESSSGKKIGIFQRQKSSLKTTRISAFQSPPTLPTTTTISHSHISQPSPITHPTFAAAPYPQKPYTNTDTLQSTPTKPLQSSIHNVSPFQDPQILKQSSKTPNWMRNNSNQTNQTIPSNFQNNYLEREDEEVVEDEKRVWNQFGYLLAETIQVQKYLEELKGSLRAYLEDVRKYFQIQIKGRITSSSFVLKVADLLKGDLNSRIEKAQNIVKRIFKNSNWIKSEDLLRIFSTDTAPSFPPKKVSFKDLLKKIFSSFIQLFYFQDSLRSHSFKNSQQIFTLLDTLQSGPQLSPQTLSRYLLESLGSKIPTTTISLFLSHRIPQKPSGYYEKSKLMLWLLDYDRMDSC